MTRLPAALQPFAEFKQFILWKPEPSTTRLGKIDKKPINYKTGRVHDPHDPEIWTDAETAYGLAAVMPEHGVGFVFTATDPFFFLDIDGALEPSGQWSALAVELCTRLQGCAVEVSQSGRGLHIFGRGPVPPHGCRNEILGLEFYDSRRFVALTGTNAIGSAAYSPPALADVVAQYFPLSASAASAEWTDEPVDEWNGPLDDDALIEKMLASRSTSAAFTNRATVQDLWHGNAEALGVSYPSGTGDDFNHSQADAALCQHLAFWTGKDCERMDRLFRRSGLVRGKWEDRQQYREDTILHAVGHCKAVYTAAARQAPATAPGAGRRDGFQFLSVDAQREHFAGCVYVRDLHRVFTPDGALLRPEQFKASFGGYVFAMDTINDKTTKNAWEAFTESQAFAFPKAHGLCFRPECAPGAIVVEEGRALVNTYVPIETPRVKGDPHPFLRHAELILPVEHDRRIFLSYMAACVQHPGVKFQWAPLLQGVEGNGKTLFINCVAQAVGNRYTHLPNASDLGGNGAKFNSWIQGKLFIGVEEIYVSDRREVSDALKPLITNSRVEIQGKGVDQITGDNRANFIMCSNHKDAILKTQNDRRYCVFFTAQQENVDLIRDRMNNGYFPELYKWLREGGYAIVNDYLRSYAIPDELNPATSCHRAPETSSTSEAVELSRGSVEQEILEAIDEGRPGFAAGWISSMAFDRLLHDRRDEKRIPRNRRREILESLGYTLHPALPAGRVNSVVPQEHGKPRLYVKKGSIQEKNLLSPCDVLSAYIKAQNYVTEAAMAFGLKV